jgi:hypothetical protein
MTITAFRARLAGRDWMRRVQNLSIWRRQNKLWGTVGQPGLLSHSGVHAVGRGRGHVALAVSCCCGREMRAEGVSGADAAAGENKEGRLPRACVRVAGCGWVGTSCTRDVMYVLLHTHTGQERESRLIRQKSRAPAGEAVHKDRN